MDLFHYSDRLGAEEHVHGILLTCGISRATLTLLFSRQIDTRMNVASLRRNLIDCPALVSVATIHHIIHILCNRLLCSIRNLGMWVQDSL